MDNELQDVLRAIIQEELKPIKDNVIKVRQELNDLRSDFSRFDETTESNFHPIEQKLEALEQKVDKRFVEIDEKVYALAGQYGKVENNITVLTNRFKKNNRI